MYFEQGGSGVEDQGPLDEFEESQEMCNRWEDKQEDRNYEDLIL